jgi:hypothetical protein
MSGDIGDLISTLACGDASADEQERAADLMDSMRALLRDLSHARPLLLYGEPWLAEIEKVLNGQRYAPYELPDED